MPSKIVESAYELQFQMHLFWTLLLPVSEFININYCELDYYQNFFKDFENFSLNFNLVQLHFFSRK